MSDQVLLVSGSLRDGSTNTALLRTARLVAPPWVTAILYAGLARLPHFNPDDDRPPLHPEVAALRAAVRAADAILFCTPEYAGALPGALKNMLEWTIGDEQPGSIFGKRVAWVNVSSAATGAADAHESLRKVLGYAHADMVDEACAAIPVTRRDVADGTVSDPVIRDAIVKVLTALLALPARGGCTLNLMPDRSRPRATRFRVQSMIGTGMGCRAGRGGRYSYRDGVRPVTERLRAASAATPAAGDLRIAGGSGTRCARG
ncbi:MAG TPA: NADPH-dependent FMN reductase [Trebonia sp.]